MDDQRRSLIITAVVTLFIIALIVGLIIFLVRFVQSRARLQSVTNASPTTSVASNAPRAGSSTAPFSSSAPRASLPASAALPSTQDGANIKIYVGPGFQLSYPKNWGVLTCNNSDNFELDPTNSNDQFKVACDRALKPVTVLVGDSPNCQGDTITLGNVQVVKSKVIGDNEVSYRWCTKTNPPLDITHRVSKVGGRASSKDDYSAQIEEMIKTWKFTSGGS